MDLALNWLDWVLVAGLGLATLWGYRVGVIRVVAGGAGSLVAFFAAGRLAAPLVQWLDRLVDLTPMVADALERRVVLPATLAETPISGASLEQIRAALSFLPLPATYREAMVRWLEAEAQTGGPTRTLGDLIISQLAHGLLSLAAFVVILFAARWLLGQLGAHASGFMDRLPLLGPANRLLGAGTALLLAGAFLAIAYGVLVPLTALPSARVLADGVAGSRLAPVLAEQYTWLARWLFGQFHSYFLEV